MDSSFRLIRYRKISLVALSRFMDPVAPEGSFKVAAFMSKIQLTMFLVRLVYI